MFEGLEAVQESEETNMLDYPAVQDFAIRMGYPTPHCGCASTGVTTPRVHFAGSRPPSRGSPPPHT